MKVQLLQNGQIEVKSENLTLTHSNIKGNKFNDCEIESVYSACVEFAKWYNLQNS